jgi:hypothetical protein
VRELLAFLQDAGHSDFRDARGPMGFTQRQAAGKFTRDEATAFIDRLQEAVDDGSGRLSGPTSGPRSAPPNQGLSRIAASCLAAELQRRGWTVIRPPGAPVEDSVL